MNKWSLLFAATLLSGMASAQPALRVKGLHPGNGLNSDVPLRTRTPGRSHWLLQFAHNPGSAELAKLANRGATVLSYIPDYAFSVSVRDNMEINGLDVQWIGRLRPEEKISAELDEKAAPRLPVTVAVEFYPDVDPDDLRAIANDAGLRILENPDLLPNHLLVRGSRAQVLALAGWDEVSYIFPASKDLSDGTPVHACAGAMTTQGPVGQAIPLIGDGWDGPGLGAANLKYVFDDVTAKLPANAAESEIVRAFSQWAKYAQVVFTPVGNSNGTKTIAILFATGAHGDGYPFVGTRVLGHTFYPFPVNPEPIAGDMHLNDAQSWRIGSGIDLFSVALHESGHALGLGHSDKPGDVMYPYYRMHTVLMPNDIAAIQHLYAAPSSASSPNPSPSPNPTPAPVPVSPLVLAVIAPPSSSRVSSIAISGTVSGGSGNAQVSWTTSAGAAGVAQGSSNWIIPAIPLNAGNNIITITAQDSQQNPVSYGVMVNYQPVNAPPPPNPNPPPAPNPPPPPNPPSGPDKTAPSLTILSPATNNYSTSSSSLLVSGTATDNVGVTSVTWATSNGASGTASGTTNWSTPPIPVYIGATTIVITAADAAGNTTWRSLTVTRN